MKAYPGWEDLRVTTPEKGKEGKEQKLCRCAGAEAGTAAQSCPQRKKMATDNSCAVSPRTCPSPDKQAHTHTL